MLYVCNRKEQEGAGDRRGGKKEGMGQPWGLSCFVPGGALPCGKRLQLLAGVWMWAHMEEAGQNCELFFLPQSHPYNQYFLNIYSVLDTVFLAGDKEMENTPQPEGQTDIDGQACGMLGESCLCLEWGGVRTPSPGDWRPPWSEVSKDEKEFSRRTTWGEACTWPLFKHTFVNHKYLLSACTC